NRKGAIAVLANKNRPYPIDPDFEKQSEAIEADARRVKRSAVVLGVATNDDIDAAFRTLKGLVKKKEVVGLAVTADPFLASRRAQIVKLANGLGIPAIYQWSSFVAEGGLMSLHPNKDEAYANAAYFCGVILKGTKAGDLGVRATKKAELVIDAAAARKLRL